MNYTRTVDVFRTNVHSVSEADRIIGLLNASFPGCRINFDLDDHERILRVVPCNVTPAEIIYLVRSAGYYCEEL